MYDFYVDYYTYTFIAVIFIVIFVYLGLRLFDKYMKIKYGESIWDYAVGGDDINEKRE